MASSTLLWVVPHTHWDREWYEPFEGYRLRLLGVVDDLLDTLERDPGFHFHFDGQTAAVEDYLAVRPENRSRIATLVGEGRLAVGPWRILMDEFLCSPETIVRNLRQGLATAASLGTRPRIGYIPDSFGHVAQMPQILALAGMTDACVWRGVPFAVNRPAFWWEAPDGTRLRTLYLATSYSNAATLPQAPEDLLVRAKRIVADMAPFAPGEVVLAMNGSDHLGAERGLTAAVAEANRRQDEIEMRIGPLAEYLALAPREELPSWTGEMRSSARANLLMGVLSARMPLKQAEFAASSTLERYAEPLAALSGFDPGALLDQAWAALVENSAHDSVCGCGIDAVASAVSERYQRALRIADGVADTALTALAAAAACPAPGAAVSESANAAGSETGAAGSETGSESGAGGQAEPPEGLFVFNPSPFERAGPAEATVALPGPSDEIAFVAAGGARCAVQPLSTTERVVVDMTLRGSELARIVPTIHSRMMGGLYVNRMALLGGRTRTVRLDLGPIPVGRFDVEAAKHAVEEAARAAPRARFRVIGAGPPLSRALVGVPSIGPLGWTSAFPVAGTPPASRVSAAGNEIGNEHVRVRAGGDGLVELEHLATGTRFSGIGLIDGGDAGDEYTYSPPDTDAVVAAPASSIAEIVSAGPLEARLRLRQLWRIPESLDGSRRRRARRTVTMPVDADWAVRAGEPFARLELRLDNLAADHRLRLRVPLAFRATGSDADTAFHVTRRGLEAEGGSHEHPTPSFPSRRWVDVSDGRLGLALIHRGSPEYEVTGTAVEATLLRCVGWLSRQDLRTRSGPAGPMLAAPGAQCAGAHRFDLALFPHAGDWRGAGVGRVAESFCHPLRAVAVHPHAGDLPAAGGALEVEPDCILLSAVERRAGAVEVRVYNASPDPVTARIRAGAPLPRTRGVKVDLTGEPLGEVAFGGGVAEAPMRGWEIATVRFE